MTFSQVFDGLEEREYYRYMLSANTVARLLKNNIGGEPLPVGRLVPIVKKHIPGYLAGEVVVNEQDMLGNHFKEKKKLYLVLEGALVGDGVVPFGFLLSDAVGHYRIYADFSKEAFINDIAAFIDKCMKFAQEIDGKRAVSFLRYGLYCLKQFGYEPIGLPEMDLPEQFLSWEQFRQVER